MFLRKAVFNLTEIACRFTPALVSFEYGTTPKVTPGTEHKTLWSAVLLKNGTRECGIGHTCVIVAHQKAGRRLT
jgi:hypothetical protein